MANVECSSNNFSEKKSSNRIQNKNYKKVVKKVATKHVECNRYNLMGNIRKLNDILNFKQNFKVKGELNSEQLKSKRFSTCN